MPKARISLAFIYMKKLRRKKKKRECEITGKCHFYKITFAFDTKSSIYIIHTTIYSTEHALKNYVNFALLLCNRIFRPPTSLEWIENREHKQKYNSIFNAFDAAICGSHWRTCLRTFICDFFARYRSNEINFNGKKKQKKNKKLPLDLHSPVR